MDKRVAEFATALGARHVATMPDVGGGAFGMARLAHIMRQQLVPGRGKRPGRPTNSRWTTKRKVSMSAETLAALEELSAELSDERRKVSVMQLAAQLLEERVQLIAKNSRRKALPKARATRQKAT